jgi:putative acetyltransferase
MMNDPVTVNDIIYRTACSETEFNEGRELFREYTESMGLDLGFQGFEAELENIGVQYNAPRGALILAYADDQPIGCTGIRELDPKTAELKRMYVKPEYRGMKIGLNLMVLALEKAKELNYQKIRLDSLETMKEARKLYDSFGFYEIGPYRFNPLPGPVFMEKLLE